MIFVEFPQRTYLGYVTKRFIKLEDIQTVGLHASGTEITLEGGYSFVTTRPILEVMAAIENARITQESLI